MHDSGQTHRTGHITKEGRKELRYVLVEAAWHAVETNVFWKAEFERLCRPPAAWSATRPSSPLLVNSSSSHLHLSWTACTGRSAGASVWHVLTEHATDHHADPDMVAFKLTLAPRLRAAQVQV